MNRLIALTLALLLAACAAEAVEPLPTPQTETPVDAILVQMDIEPTYSLPRYFQPFGRVKPFTLYADGRVFYTAPAGENGGQQLMTAQLTPEEVTALLDELRADGITQIETYTDFCNPTNDQECIADAGLTLLRFRTDADTLRETRNYAGFAENAEALAAVTDRLGGYTHPQAEPYQPQTAALFVSPAFEQAQDAPAWPLDPGLLRAADAADPAGTQLAGSTQIIVLDAAQIEAVLALTGSNAGAALVESEGTVYSIDLVPWLPGEDYTDEVTEFQQQ
ncbi:MAG: hypothetical protein GYB64_08575 [Chloroflexi bacterium]|nr:hypothetical protein [Chloroflexota bacterium]